MLRGAGAPALKPRKLIPVLKLPRVPPCPKAKKEIANSQAVRVIFFSWFRF